MIKNIIKVNENRWVDVSDLIRTGSFNYINWNKSIGQKVEFSYDGTNGCFTLHSLCETNKNINIEYDNKILTIKKSNITDCLFSYMLNIRTSEFRYNIGEIVETKLSKIVILNQFVKNKKKSYSCKCLSCNHEFNKSEETLLNLTNCQFCLGKYVILGKTDMWSTNPYLASLLLNPDDGYNFKEHSNKYADWKCPDCGKILLHKKINDVSMTGLICPECADGLKTTEKFFSNFLSSINIDYITQLNKINFKWCENYKYDFYTDYDNLNMVVETHGIQHYEESTMTSRSLKEEQENDNIKELLANTNEIKHYIVLNFSHSTLSWMKNSIMNSELPSLLNFKESDIDWNKVFLDAQRSYVFKSCELWNKGKSILEISACLKIADNTVRSYLKKGVSIGICTYDSQKEREISIKNLHYYSDDCKSKPIICIENNHIFKSINLSSIEMSKLYDKNFNHSNISAVCLGTRKSHQGFSFKYITKEEFNISKTESPELTFGDFFILPKSKSS